MKQEPTITQLFEQVGDAVSDADALLSADSTVDLTTLRRTIHTVFTKMDRLLAALAPLPPHLSEMYHPALTHLLEMLESFHGALERARKHTATELQTLSKRQRAFMTYLTTHAVKS